ncbi:hypothetical protein [Bosea vaviloviae]|uniref:Uncharacterized protein n=1 Tax=Bosea vaviloviae TaxID=1526658 RepID=A0A1D7U762_9HYPH|nr:hypothetical protein [Bosea vaviloviae]AOO83204.1 hypothetical protein BHK69_24620 [Bosea vaviloviae]
MFRLLLIIAVLAIGYDAVVHQGAYTRSAWTSIVGLADSAVTNAKNMSGTTREEPRSQTN